MALHACPWWLGYLLASRLRRLISDDPHALLAPYVRAGMTVLEPGPGMGYFTLELARLVGLGGRVIGVDIQEKVLAGLRRRARKHGLVERIDLRHGTPEVMPLADVAGTVDFALVFAVVHETPSANEFFRQVAVAMKEGGTVLFAEPRGHVREAKFEKETAAASAAGLEFVTGAAVRRCHAVVLRKG